MSLRTQWRRFCESVWIWAAAIPVTAIIAIALSLWLVGCATFDQEITVQPQIDTVIATVVWVDAEGIRKVCDNGAACATVATPERPYSTIWAQRPESFSDRRTCQIGHEFLHALGARHR